MIYESVADELLRHPATLARHCLLHIREHVDRFDAMMHCVSKLKVQSVLDLGCSLGLTGWFLRNHGNSVNLVHGVDWSKSCTTIAKTWFDYDETWTEDVRELNLDRKYDLVIATEILEHVFDSERVVQSVQRHASKYALFSTPEEQGSIDGNYHVKVFTKDELEGLLKMYFETVRVWFVRSHYCEKPKWQGWNFALGEL